MKTNVTFEAQTQLFSIVKGHRVHVVYLLGISPKNNEPEWLRFKQFCVKQGLTLLSNTANFTKDRESGTKSGIEDMANRTIDNDDCRFDMIDIGVAFSGTVTYTFGVGLYKQTPLAVVYTFNTEQDAWEKSFVVSSTHAPGTPELAGAIQAFKREGMGPYDTIHCSTKDANYGSSDFFMTVVALTVYPNGFVDERKDTVVKYALVADHCDSLRNGYYVNCAGVSEVDLQRVATITIHA